MATSTSASRFMYRSVLLEGGSYNVEIMLDGKCVGEVFKAAEGKEGYQMKLRVWKTDPDSTKHPEIPWQWCYITNVFPTVEDLKAYLKENFFNVLDLRVELYTED